MKQIILIIILNLLILDYINACTTFVLKGANSLIYGRNFDWDIGKGFIVINKKGIEKQAFVPPPNKPARWTSKYGSVTFNQIGIDVPMSGINTRGLVIAQMGLFESEFPKTDNKQVVNGLEWIQFQLDNSSTLSDVIENNKKIRIITNIVPVHYFICDSLGNIGVIEYINGKLVLHQDKDISIPVCSNMIYEHSKKALEDYKEFGCDKEIPAKWNNVSDIIAIANSKIQNYKSKYANNNPIDYGFEILHEVSSKTRTQWSIIYDIKNKSINFKTLNNKNTRKLELNTIEFECHNDIHILDIHDTDNNNFSYKNLRTLTYDYYFQYKKELVKLYKTKTKGFPDISDEVIKLEVEYAINRICE